MGKGVTWLLAVVLVAVLAGLSGMAHSLGDAAAAGQAQTARSPGKGVPALPTEYDKLLRLHVVANSDTAEDQAVKRQVRDAVLELLAPALNRARSVEEAKQAVLVRQEEVRRAAEQVVRQAGKPYGVRVEVGRFLFPTKVYGDTALPAGRYDALRISLGAAEGQNWWCVLFPPLCLVDAAGGVAVVSSGPQTSPGLQTAGAKEAEPIPGAPAPESGASELQNPGLRRAASAWDPAGPEPPLQVRYALLEWLKMHPLSPRLIAWLEARGWHLVPEP